MTPKNYAAVKCADTDESFLKILQQVMNIGLWLWPQNYAAVKCADTDENFLKIL
jgi:glutamate-1-semialdehyde aminotransferase